MRDRGRAFVEAERNWASNVARYQPLYQRLIAARRPGAVVGDASMVDA